MSRLGTGGRHVDRITRRRPLVGGLSWLALAVLLVVAVTSTGLPARTELLIGPVAFGGFYLVDVLWVRHNRRIYARKGARRLRVAGVAQPWTHDRQGRSLSGDLHAAWHGGEVALSSAAGVKHYASPVRP